MIFEGPNLTGSVEGRREHNPYIVTIHYIQIFPYSLARTSKSWGNPWVRNLLWSYDRYQVSIPRAGSNKALSSTKTDAILTATT